MAQVHLADEVKRVDHEGEQTLQQPSSGDRRIGIGHRQRPELHFQQSLLASILIDLEEGRRILMTMLDAVYVDTVEEKRIVAIRPRPSLRPLLEIATTRESSGIVLITETPPEPGRPGG